MYSKTYNFFFRLLFLIFLVSFLFSTFFRELLISSCTKLALLTAVSRTSIHCTSTWQYSVTILVIQLFYVFFGVGLAISLFFRWAGSN